MRTASLIKGLFVVGSCVFTGVLLLALTISTVATVVFDATWMRETVVRLNVMFADLTDSEPTIDAAGTEPPPYKPSDGSRQPAVGGRGTPEYRLEELRSVTQVSPRQREALREWGELKPALLEILNEFLGAADDNWVPLDGEGDLIRRREEIHSALAAVRLSKQSAMQDTLARIPKFQAAEMIRAMCQDENGECSEFDGAVSLLRDMPSIRRAEILRFLIDVDAKLAANLWSLLAEEVASTAPVAPERN